MSDASSMNNPAGRLRYWIARFDTYGQRDQAVSVAAAELLGHSGSSQDFDAQVAFMRIGTSLAEMCQEVRREVALLPEYLHPEMLLSDFSQVEQYVSGFGLARQTQVQHLNAPLDNAGRRGLEYIDRYLSTNRPQAWIEEDTRSSLTDQVRDFIDQVLADDNLDPETKRFVTGRLTDVETALRDVRLTGTPAIERATDALVGSVRREPVMWQRIVEGGLGDLLSGLVMALIVALGHQPADNVLPPSQHTVVIDNGTTKIHVDQTVVPKKDDDVVDAEIVEDNMPSPTKELK